ncbi:MAG: hypothetical protein JXA53_08175 [Bacteroidales bacterium]|nr:hypothetical protein [Bacteroidales bacterium]
MTLDDNAKKIMINYILKYYSDYLDFLKPYDYKDHNITVSPFYIDGKTQPEFGELVEKGLKDSPNNKVLIEMQDYYNELSKIETVKIEG